MATIRFSNTLANAMLGQIASVLDGGSGNATICVYTGTMPASPDAALAGNTLLATLTCSKPSGTAATKTLTFATITQDSGADANGTATWARIFKSDGTAHIDVDVSMTGGSGALQFNTVAFESGVPVGVSTLTISLP